MRLLIISVLVVAMIGVMVPNVFGEKTFTVPERDEPIKRIKLSVIAPESISPNSNVFVIIEAPNNFRDTIYEGSMNPNSIRTFNYSLYHDSELGQYEIIIYSMVDGDILVDTFNVIKNIYQNSKKVALNEDGINYTLTKLTGNSNYVISISGNSDSTAQLQDYKANVKSPDGVSLNLRDYLKVLPNSEGVTYSLEFPLPLNPIIGQYEFQIFVNDEILAERTFTLINPIYVIPDYSCKKYTVKDSAGVLANVNVKEFSTDGILINEFNSSTGEFLNNHEVFYYKISKPGFDTLSLENTCYENKSKVIFETELDSFYVLPTDDSFTIPLQIYLDKQDGYNEVDIIILHNESPIFSGNLEKIGESTYSIDFPITSDYSLGMYEIFTKMKDSSGQFEDILSSQGNFELVDEIPLIPIAPPSKFSMCTFFAVKDTDRKLIPNANIKFFDENGRSIGQLTASDSGQFKNNPKAAKFTISKDGYESITVKNECFGMADANEKSRINKELEQIRTRVFTSVITESSIVTEKEVLDIFGNSFDRLSPTAQSQLSVSHFNPLTIYYGQILNSPTISVQDKAILIETYEKMGDFFKNRIKTMISNLDNAERDGLKKIEAMDISNDLKTEFITELRYDVELQKNTLINLGAEINTLHDDLISEQKGLQKSREELSGGGCLIATAAYGSEMAPQVQFLREIRDNTVLQTTSGTTFMNTFNQFYYSFSPQIADYERENPVFKEMVKVSLTPLLTSLTLLNYVEIDSEEEMLGYGIGIILLNVGMYFVAPAVLIISLKKRLDSFRGQ